MASGRVVTWLSARNAAKILMRIISMKESSPFSAPVRDSATPRRLF
jgi:hypothetical protein